MTGLAAAVFRPLIQNQAGLPQDCRRIAAGLPLVFRPLIRTKQDCRSFSAASSRTKKDCR